MKKWSTVVLGGIVAIGACDLDDRSLGGTPDDTEEGDEGGDGDGEEGVSLLDGDGVPPSCDQSDDYEPNGSKETSTPHPWGGQLVGELCGEDIDVFKVEFGTAVGWLEPSLAEITQSVRTRLYRAEGPELLCEMVHGQGQEDFHAYLRGVDDDIYVTLQLVDPNGPPTSYQLAVDRGFPDEAYVCDDLPDGAECSFLWDGDEFDGACAESQDWSIGATHPVCVVRKQ